MSNFASLRHRFGNSDSGNLSVLKLVSIASLRAKRFILHHFISPCPLWQMTSVSVIVTLFCATHGRAEELATSPAEAGPAFKFVGEYVGTITTSAQGRWQNTRIGLQVVALGNGQFKGVEYLGGLPGAGWKGRKKAVLPGKMSGNVVILDAVPVDVVVDGITAEVGIPGETPAFGTLRRINRASPTLGMRPPRQAEILFARGHAGGLKNVDITKTGLLAEGAVTTEPYSDFTLHLEFRLPFMPDARSQGRGNSGVYLQQRYEIQILNSFGNEPVYNGAGAIYRTKPPRVNMTFPPLRWQTYDIRFHPAQFENGKKVTSAKITVWHNGVKIHDDVSIPHKTGAGQPEGPNPLPLRFQDHGNPVRFRNIWIVDQTKYPNVVATPRIIGKVAD